VKVHSLEEVIRSRKFHPSIEWRLRQAQEGPENGPDTPACKAEAEYRDQFRAAVAKAMDDGRLDAFVYPTWSNPPRLIGDLNTPAGDNSQVFSPTTGWPAINVPMGYTRGTLPAGMTFFGRAWSEASLIKFAYAYEQSTHHRRPPASAPPLR
jgi:Asp-tRNA(Asn)/Glu-tRNA(Gln) amidotransferase A subunit family amidase